MFHLLLWCWWHSTLRQSICVVKVIHMMVNGSFIINYHRNLITNDDSSNFNSSRKYFHQINSFPNFVPWGQKINTSHLSSRQRGLSDFACSFEHRKAPWLHLNWGILNFSISSIVFTQQRNGKRRRIIEIYLENFSIFVWIG